MVKDPNDPPDLFDWEPPPPPKKIAYQQTSRETWHDTVPLRAELDRLILAEIDRHGEEGIICAQIEANISRSHQAVSGNLRHLVERELVEFSGSYGRTASGRKAMRWRIKRNAP